MKHLLLVTILAIIGATLIVSRIQKDQGLDQVQFSLLPPCGHPDSIALMALYHATDGPNWTNNDGWGDTCDVCAWSGVHCAGGRVTRVLLASRNLTGTIPPEIGLLDAMEHLHLHQNSLVGTLPPELNDLINLKTLWLSDNDLTGILPTLTNLQDLNQLLLSQNSFSGNVSEQLSDLVNLELLWLSINDFSGTLSSELGSLTNLRQLLLDRNQLSGQIPPEIGNLSNLENLHLFNNQFEGCLPPTFMNFCFGIDIRYNNNSCLWQGDFNDFCNGETCTFTDYSLTAIPSSKVCSGSSINLQATGGGSYFWSTGETTSSIAISPINDTNYQVTITTPGGCVRFDSIQISVLPEPVVITTGSDPTVAGGSDGSVSASALGGTPPYAYLWNNGQNTAFISGLTAGTYYVTLTDAQSCIDSSSVTISDPVCAPAGSLCDDGNPTTVNDVEDGNCHCEGELGGDGCHPDFDALMAIYDATGGPGWTNMVDWGTDCDVCSWTNVQCNGNGRVNNLILQFDLIGDVPNELGDLSELEVLRIFNNQITSLPASIGNLTKLTYLEVAFESLITAIPSEIGNLTDLETLYFDYTGATTIPLKLGDLTNLKLLCLEGSQLSGSIPSTFSNLTNLEILNLYGNQLSGELPCYFGNFPNLMEIWLADNNFEGCIPSSYTNFCSLPGAFISPNPGLQEFSDFCAGEQCLQHRDLISSSTDTIGCPGDIITLSAPPATQYNWSTGEATESISFSLNRDTSISVFLTQESGCTFWDEIIIAMAVGPTISVSIEDASSGTSKDGSIEIFISGGNPSFTYLWSTGVTTKDLSDVAAGDYCLTITDNSNCNSVYNYSIGVLCAEAGTPCDDGDENTFQDQEDGHCNCAGTPCPTIQVIPIVNRPLCYGDTTGTIGLEITGGILPYTYAWSDGSNSSLLENQPSGIYGLTLTDNNGCEVKRTFGLSEPDSLRTEIIASAESLPGASDGELNLTVRGGTRPYRYHWSNGAADEDLFALSGGTFSVTVTDAHGCTTIDSSLISTKCPPKGHVCDDLDPNTYLDQENGSCTCLGIPCPSLQLNATIEHPSCFENTDGLIMLLPLGGSNPYTAEWSDGVQGLDRIDLAAGIYALTLSDANGCEDVFEFELLDPPPLELNLISSAESAPGSRDGAISTEVRGGLAPYAFLWSNGSSLEDLTNLTGQKSSYIVTVTDARGCNIVDSVSLQTNCASLGTACDDGDSLTFMDLYDGNCQCVGVPCSSMRGRLFTSDISCFGALDGRAILKMLGGKPPFTINWSNGINNLDTIIGLAADIYSVEVMDAAGCKWDSLFILTEPPHLQVDISISHESGLGQMDGTVDLMVIGGQSPYRFNWSNDKMTKDLKQLIGERTYSVTVTDLNGCTIVDSARVSRLCGGDTSAIIFDDLLLRHPSTCSTEDGRIEIKATSAIGQPLQYSIDGGVIWSAYPIFSDLAQGRYSIFLRHQTTGCAIEFSADLGDPVPITFSSFQFAAPTDCGAEDGYLRIVSHGSNLEYSIDHGKSWREEPDFDSLGSNLYQVHVRDKSATCRTILSKSFDLRHQDQPRIEEVEVYPAYSCLDQLGSIELIPSPTTKDFEIRLNDGVWQKTTIVDQILPGSHRLFVRSVNKDCVIEWEDSIHVSDWRILDLNSINYINPTSCEQDDGIIEITGSTGKLEFSIDGGSSWSMDDRFQNLGGGDYAVLVRDRDATECHDTVQITLISSAVSSLLTSEKVLNPTCVGAKDGLIEVMTSNPSQIFTWSDGFVGSLRSGLPAGDYSLVVEDSNGCVQIHQYQLDDPEPINLNLPNLDSSLLCLGDELDFTLDSSYTYLWYLDEIFIGEGPRFKGVEPGEYSVVAVDEMGCQQYESFEINYSDQVFRANFLISSQAVVNQPLIAIETSWPVPEVIEWEIIGGQVLDQSLNQMTMSFGEPGTHIVRLLVSTGTCTSIIEKQVRVFESADLLDLIVPNFKGIKSATIFPNPNQGNFNVQVELTSIDDLQTRIYNNGGSLIYSSRRSGRDFYQNNISMDQPIPGIYNILFQTSTDWRSLHFAIN